MSRVYVERFDAFGRSVGGFARALEWVNATSFIRVDARADRRLLARRPRFGVNINLGFWKN